LLIASSAGVKLSRAAGFELVISGDFIERADRVLEAEIQGGY
jgi:hypothetical protein